MPAMHFHLRWPDGSQTRCYSPSLVIKDCLEPGVSYPLPDFMQRVGRALHIASERVRAKYGFACSMALDQLSQIERDALPYARQPDARVAVTRFEE